MNPSFSRRLVTLCASLLAIACTHQTLSSQLQSQAQSFSQARDQAIAVVRAAKHNVGPVSINDVNLKYAALQEQANGYLGLVVEAINTGSLDGDKSGQDATGLTKAIDGFNGSVEPLLNPKSAALTPGAAAVPLPLSDQWVGNFKANLDASWPSYQKELSGMSSQQRTALGEQLKAQLAWPNFESIATEPVPSIAPHGGP